jgi:hypothetical protein
MISGLSVTLRISRMKDFGVFAIRGAKVYPVPVVVPLPDGADI